MERCGEVIGGLYDTSHIACKSDTTVISDTTRERLCFFHTLLTCVHVMRQDNPFESNGGPF